MTALACSRLTLDYPGVPVLAGIDLVIADGEVMALLGASGSGKTTLIHAVAGFVTPTAGETGKCRTLQQPVARRDGFDRGEQSRCEIPRASRGPRATASRRSADVSAWCSRIMHCGRT